MSDPYEGQGGSYRVDPKTGRRELVERTREERAPQPAPEPAQNPPGQEGA